MPFLKLTEISLDYHISLYRVQDDDLDFHFCFELNS